MTTPVREARRERRHGEPRPLTVPLITAGTQKTVITSPCRLIGYSLQMAAPGAAVEVNAAVTGPAAGGTIVATPALTGTFEFAVTVYVDGTTTSADDDNMQFVTAANNGMINPAVAAQGIGYPVTYEFLETLSAATASVKAVAAGGAAAVYHASILRTPVPLASAVISDSGQPLAYPSFGPNVSDTQRFSETGLYISTNITVQALTGNIQGTLFILDAWNAGGET